jgi:hypothetical protein
MQKLPLFVAALATAGALAAQNPRANVQIDTAAGKAVAPSVISDGNFSAILYKDDFDNTLMVTTSDGRGLTWSTPVRIDDDATNARKFIEYTTMVYTDGNLYAAWSDERNGSDDDVYFAANLGAGWTANVLLDKGYPSGGNPVREMSIDAEGLNVAVLLSPDNGDEDLYLVVSTDGGATFSAAMAVGAHNGLGDVDDIDVKVDGNAAHIAWVDNTADGVNDALYYSAYDFGSASFTSQDVALSTNVTAGLGDIDSDIAMSVDAGNIAIGFTVDGINGPSNTHEMWINAKTGGVWTGDQMIGGYIAGTDDVDNPAILVNGSNLTIAWEDNRTGADEMFVASSDMSGGTVVVGNETQLSTIGAGYPRLRGAGDYVACIYSGAAFPNTTDMACSNDGGLTFGPSIILSTNTGDVDFSEGAFNALYGNFVSVWLADDLGVNHAYAGGARCQSLNPVGTLVSGDNIHFEASSFGASENGTFFGVAVSGGTGSYLLPFGDGRETGLVSDFYLSYSLAHIPGTLSSTLTGGAGATVDIPLAVPAGTVIYYCAVGFEVGGILNSLTDTFSFTVL